MEVELHNLGSVRGNITNYLFQGRQASQIPRQQIIVIDDNSMIRDSYSTNTDFFLLRTYIPSNPQLRA